MAWFTRIRFTFYRFHHISSREKAKSENGTVRSKTRLILYPESSIRWLFAPFPPGAIFWSWGGGSGRVEIALPYACDGQRVFVA